MEFGIETIKEVHKMKRAYYSHSVEFFLRDTEQSIFGEIMTNDQSAAEDLQRNTWHAEIQILKRELANFRHGHLLFEYTIPRIGSRIDNVFIYQGVLFLIEFKVGETEYQNYAIEQVIDYALDLKNFHKESHNKFLVPILVCTRAKEKNNNIIHLQDDILEPLCCNATNIGKTIEQVIDQFTYEGINSDEWVNSLYMPTPTIVEAAQALYRGHNVDEISRNDASAVNLNSTTLAINRIIDDSKANHKKSICFITGVPGAGKTLAGLNISIERQKIDDKEHAVFLSGNGPLVDVLQEALARDDSERNKIKKTDAMRKAKEFIQIIHHFRDDAISVSTPPIEKVAIFDEAQRAWTEDMLSKFMTQKKGVFDFNMSEPEFLISVMDRHQDWAVIICLIGGGQEINTGEAGLTEWFNSLKKNYPDWKVYVSDKITDIEYSKGMSIPKLLEGMNHEIVEDLHLSVSLRSFRSEKVSAFVKALLDIDLETACMLYDLFKSDYPICITRNLDVAKDWIKGKAKGTERFGLTASSGAKRLRSYGVWVQSKIDSKTWFLNDKDDVRASYFLEETATEFDIQGLELDWTIVCWDADLRVGRNGLEFYSFTGSKWMNICKPENANYLKNAYRVLLTRARQGFVIFVPEGNENDKTRKCEYYDGIYQYLKDIGIKEI